MEIYMNSKEKKQEPIGEQLTLFPVGSREDHASLLVLPGSKKARRTTAISGRKCSELFKRSGPLGLLQKMLLESYRWGSTRRNLSWKALDMKCNHLLFQLVPLTPRTEETGCGLLPTPTATDYKGSTLCQVKRRKTHGGGMTLREHLAYLSNATSTVYPNPQFLEKIMGYPKGWTELKH